MEVRNVFAVAVISGLGLLSGCDATSQGGTAPPTATASPLPAPATSAPPVGQGHEHPTEGPRHGALIELGNEEFHAELLHDERNGVVTIFLMDSAARNGVAGEGVAIINAMYRGRPAQFKLAGSRNDASRFDSNDPALGEALDASGANASLSVVIDGRVYRGRLPAHDHGHDHVHDDGHDHSHDGHDHDHGHSH